MLHIVHEYPSNVLFGRLSSKGLIEKFICTSILVTQDYKQINLYRIIVRVSNGAFQLLEATYKGEKNLYSDSECQETTQFTFSKKWSFPEKAPDEGDPDIPDCGQKVD